MTGRERFIAAVEGKPVDRPPVWLMRQAGRYLPEYRALRERFTFSEMYRKPELAIEVTLQPIRRFGFDGAILFSDILVVPEAMGIPVDFPNGGPVLSKPVRTRADVEALLKVDPREKLGFVRDALLGLRKELGNETALLGFSGAPYTLACYAIDGTSEHDFIETKKLEWKDPALFEALLDKLTDTVAEYLVMQVEAGADVVQLFDSWGGHLAPDEWRKYALPRAKRIFDRVKAAGGRTIHFVLDSGTFLESVAEAGSDVVGIDWHTPFPDAVRRVGQTHSLQGNLEPYMLVGSPENVVEKTRQLVQAGRNARGHILNVGHGVTPHTRIDCVEALLRTVKESAR
jgi:uroporphyrinogen decarboxylase